MTKSKKVLRNNASLSMDEHRELAALFGAQRNGATKILNILNGRIRTNYLDRLTKFVNQFGHDILWRLRCDLEGDMFVEHPEEATIDIYYDGDGNPVETLAAQRRVGAWVRDCFGDAAMCRRERAVRLLEEAIELAQAEGAPADLVHRLADAVYAKPVGDPPQEAAGVGVGLLGWADAAGVNFWDITLAEIDRIHSKSVDHFRARHRIKSDAGIALPATEDRGTV